MTHKPWTKWKERDRKRDNTKQSNCIYKKIGCVDFSLALVNVCMCVLCVLCSTPTVIFGSIWFKVSSKCVSCEKKPNSAKIAKKNFDWWTTTTSTAQCCFYDREQDNSDCHSSQSIATHNITWLCICNGHFCVIFYSNLCIVRFSLASISPIFFRLNNGTSNHTSSKRLANCVFVAKRALFCSLLTHCVTRYLYRIEIIITSSVCKMSIFRQWFVETFNFFNFCVNVQRLNHN